MKGKGKAVEEEEEWKKKTGRQYCWTLYKFEDPEKDIRDIIAKQNEKKNFTITYACWQLEKCPRTGRDHLQGFFQLDQAQRYTAIKRLSANFGTAHFEATKGSSEANEIYCSKTESRLLGPFRHGSMDQLGQGNRTDLATAADIIKRGLGLKRVADEQPTTFIKYHRGLEAYSKIIDNRQRTWKTRWILYWGDPGSGKSMAAASYGQLLCDTLEDGDRYNTYDEKIYHFSPANDAIWWDGYNGQPVIIFDDIYGRIPWTLLLRLGDQGPLQLQIKGGSVPFLGRWCIFTSNTHFADWYKYEKNINYGAIDRRFTKVVKFEGIYPTVTRTTERNGNVLFGELDGPDHHEQPEQRVDLPGPSEPRRTRSDSSTIDSADFSGDESGL